MPRPINRYYFKEIAASYPHPSPDFDNNKIIFSNPGFERRQEGPENVF